MQIIINYSQYLVIISIFVVFGVRVLHSPSHRCFHLCPSALPTPTIRPWAPSSWGERRPARASVSTTSGRTCPSALDLQCYLAGKALQQ